MPRRAPINPHGCYHVGTRGGYGQVLFRTPSEHELFLRLFDRAAVKYGWVTLDWALVWNHHHFIIELTNGGLSEGMRELHGGFSRRIHLIYGLTSQGHLVRHGFFARELASDGDVLGACRYVDTNIPLATGCSPSDAEWCGYRATVGLEHPRSFHRPAALLERISSSPSHAQRAWTEYVQERLDEQRRVSSPNDVFGPPSEWRG